MRNAYLRCGGRDDDERECFELILPVSFVMPDGSTITVENDSDWVDLRSWYEENPDAEEHPELQYPVDILFDDETVTINNPEEMNIVKRECWEYEDEGRECFGLVYPVTFIMPDGSSIVVATDDENSLKLFEEGMKLTEECRKMLEDAEEKIKNLLGEED